MTNPLIPGGGEIVFSLIIIAMLILFVLVFIAAVAFIIVTVVRNGSKVRQAGVDPMTLQTDIAVAALKSDLLAPTRTPAQRLADIDALLAASSISPNEHAAARAKILAEL